MHKSRLWNFICIAIVTALFISPVNGAGVALAAPNKNQPVTGSAPKIITSEVSVSQPLGSIKVNPSAPDANIAPADRHKFPTAPKI